MTQMQRIRGREIYDSRRHPTVEVDVVLESGARGRAGCRRGPPPAPARRSSAASKCYDRDLAVEEYTARDPCFHVTKARERFCSIYLHEILNVIFVILRDGVLWWMLPEGFPHWKTVP